MGGEDIQIGYCYGCGALNFTKINLHNVAMAIIRITNPGTPPRLDNMRTPSIPLVAVIINDMEPIKTPQNIFN